MQKMINKKWALQEKRKLQTRKENESKQNSGITLIALVVTIVLNCSYLAMVEANPI